MKFKSTLMVMMVIMIAAITTFTIWGTTETDSCDKPKYNRTTTLCSEFNNNHITVTRAAYPIWDRTRR